MLVTLAFVEESRVPRDSPPRPVAVGILQPVVVGGTLDRPVGDRLWSEISRESPNPASTWLAVDRLS